MGEYKTLDDEQSYLEDAISDAIDSSEAVGFYFVKTFGNLSDEKKDELLKKTDEYTRIGEGVYDKKGLIDHPSPVILVVSPRDPEGAAKKFIDYMSSCGFDTGISGCVYTEARTGNLSSLETDLAHATMNLEKVNSVDRISLFEIN